MWPSIDSSYALAAVSLASLVYVLVHFTRFISQQNGIVERISLILENHMSDIAYALQAICDRLDSVEKKLEVNRKDADDIS